MNSLWAYDEALWAEYPLLCGVDEAGRGPLCGPVCVGAAILDPARPIEGLNDSKKLTEKKRGALFPVIQEYALAWNVVMVGPEEIDRINILAATLLGMKQAVEGLSRVPDMVLVDGDKTPDTALCCRPVIKGDSTSASIAAASILAKVSRDAYMKELSKEFPEYKLEKHKGYPTREHYEILGKYGIQSFYRRSFLKKSGLV